MNGDLISREAAVQMLMEKSHSYVVSLFPTSDECKTAREIAKECAEAVRQMPAVDAVEVVHCKDCISSKELPSHARAIFVPGTMRCTHGRGILVKGYSVIQPKDFCSSATKKMDGDADG